MKSSPSLNRNTILAGVCSASLVTLAVSAMLSSAADATHQPADKMAVSGSGLDILSVDWTTPGGHSETHTLLTGTLRTSSPTDLIFRVTSECALWTNIGTQGNAFAESEASVKFWVELDGNVVPVAADDVNEPGNVVFCNRAWRQEMTGVNSEDENLTLKQFMRTRQADGFNWITMNVGNGIHQVTLMAQLDLNLQGGPLPGQAPGMATNLFAKAGVGKRTLIVEPVKLATDASV